MKFSIRTMAMVAVTIASLAACTGCAQWNRLADGVGLERVANPCARAEGFTDRAFCLQQSLIAVQQTCVELTDPSAAPPDWLVIACAEGSESATPAVKIAVEAAATAEGARLIYERAKGAGADGLTATSLSVAAVKAATLANDRLARARPLVAAFIASLEAEPETHLSETDGEGGDL